jgi:threonine dehydrogenase-like Zn-dependent dehydrogenase
MKAVLSETPGRGPRGLDQPCGPVLTDARAAFHAPSARGKLQLEIIGHDFAGTVTAAGAAVTQFDVGDEVFGAFMPKDSFWKIIE